MTDLNTPELYRPGEGEVIDPAQAAINTEVATPGKLLQKTAEEKIDQAKNTVTAARDNLLSRRDFLKLLKAGTIAISALGISAILFIKRNGIVAFLEKIASNFTIEKIEPDDPRILSAFGKDYPAWAAEQSDGQYGMYLTGVKDNSFNPASIPQPQDKDNVVWLLTYQQGITWPFVTPERDGKLRDPLLYPLPPQTTFVDNLAGYLGLNDDQKIDLSQRWSLLSQDQQAVFDWLNDLKSQGVPQITDRVIEFYRDPITYITGASR